MDYSSNNSNKSIEISKLTGINNQIVNNLFEEAINSVLIEGSSNRFWNIFSDLLPKGLNFQDSNITRHTRQSNQNFINVSPLKVQALVQLTSQSSPEARAIDATSTIGLSVSANLAKKLQTFAIFKKFW